MRESLFERTVTESFPSAPGADDQLFVTLFNRYYCIHRLDSTNTLRCLKSRVSPNSKSELIEQIKASDWVNSAVHQKLVASTGQATLIPDNFYHSKLKRAYAQLNFGPQERQVALTNHLPSLQAYLLFTVDQAFYQDWSLAFEHQELLHVATPWLNAVIQQFRDVKGPVLCFDVEDPLLRIAVIRGGRLQLFNTFSMGSTSDLLYYLVQVAQALDVDPHQDPFYGSGLFFRHTERFQQLYRYIRYLRLLKQQDAFTDTRHLEEFPDHLFYNILGLPLCAS